jgi:hypothetical protein
MGVNETRSRGHRNTVWHFETKKRLGQVCVPCHGVHNLQYCVFRRVRKIAKSDNYLRHVCPSVRTEELGSHWTDCHEIWFLSIFRKSVEKIQVWLQSDKNNGYFTWRPMYICDSYVFPLAPVESGRLRLRIFMTFGTMKVVRSSVLNTGRLYPQEFPGTHF